MTLAVTKLNVQVHLKKSSPISKENANSGYVGHIVQYFLSCFKSLMSSRLRMQVLNYIFKSIIMETGGRDYLNYVNADFLVTCLVQ